MSLFYIINVKTYIREAVRKYFSRNDRKLFAKSLQTAGLSNKTKTNKSNQSL